MIDDFLEILFKRNSIYVSGSKIANIRGNSTPSGKATDGSNCIKKNMCKLCSSGEI